MKIIMTKSAKKQGITPIGIIVLLVIGFLWLSNYLTSPERAYKELDKYLKKQYGEEFVIGHMGRRKLNGKEWYEAGVVYPKRYVGTVKENDTYYWGRGFAEIKAFGFDVGDDYGGVLLDESANEFYGKKLKELFGENVLPILKIDGEYKYTDFPKEASRVRKTILGGIYIFGRVENDEDREWYRQQIYEFVQFMKQTGTFEYVSLNVAVVDERILSEEYQNNSEFIKKLIQKAETNNIEWQEYRDFRRELYNKNFPKNYTLKTNLNDINKAKILEHVGEWSNYNALLYIKIYSPKYLESNPALKKEKRLYNKVEDIKFGYETW